MCTRLASTVLLPDYLDSRAIAERPTQAKLWAGYAGRHDAHPDGSTLYVVNDNANNVITIDTSSNKVIGLPLPAGYFPYADQLSPDGTKLYVTNWGVADRSFGPAYVASYDKTAGSGIGSLFIGAVPRMCSPTLPPIRPVRRRCPS
jgi:hypothetical protein